MYTPTPIARWFMRLILVTTFCAIVFCLRAEVRAQSTDESKEENIRTDVEKESIPPTIAQAALAAELALRGEKAAESGEKQKAAILLLAASELLSELKESDRSSDTVSVNSDMLDAEDSIEANWTPKTLVSAARKVSFGNDDLRAFVDYVSERSRGLVESQGRDLDTVTIQGVPFKVLLKTKVSPGKYWDLNNVRFEGERPAIVVVIGDGDGDLDLVVHDEKSGGMIGKDNDTTSRCVVQWVPRYTGPFKLHVHNVGRQWERFVVLANW